MQTSSKVTSAKKVGLLAGLFSKLLGKEKAIEPIGSVGGKGHYFECKGAIEHAYQCRGSQRQRRKLARRTA